MEVGTHNDNSGTALQTWFPAPITSSASGASTSSSRITPAASTTATACATESSCRFVNVNQISKRAFESAQLLLDAFHRRRIISNFFLDNSTPQRAENM